MTNPILFVLTSHDQLGDTGKPTGFHWEEMTTPYWILRDAGYEVEIASIKGGNPPFDPGSLKKDEQENPESVNRFRSDAQAMKALENSMAINQVNALRYDGLYLPGGHGTMWDLPNSQPLAEIISDLYADGKVIAAICHGPAGLVNAKDRSTGNPLVEGKRVNCFTDAEEREVQLEEVLPFMLEDTLRNQGARFENSGIFAAHAVSDKRLITGQNPASAARLGQLIVDALKQQAAAKAA